MKNSKVLVTILIVQSIVVMVYTLLATTNEGINFVNVFLKNIQSLTWNSQFTVDFSCYLLLSGLWIMWRSNFSYRSIFIGIIAMILGIVFFAPYLLYLSAKEKGNVYHILIGEHMS